MRAYTAAAGAAIAAARRVTVQPCVHGVLRVDYALYEQAQRLLAEAGAQQEETQFSHCVTIPFVLLLGRETALRESLQQLCRGSVDLTFSEPYFAPFG